ncbi:MAG: type I glyceraldehyde-3-phosphate dehydrogenase [Furfurilactobacillus sp.]|jgi:glyceraldehyde 3-phosphate dehydrogenase|uniref:Glyceraldehyde-3-phosphate dehydrogenase n=1 Tax=Furfurilactobacillus milii TaxID=2888272 RepID=A0ABT6DBR2_9LACO|nr:MULTISPECIES: type I glyceraldehyde-3-phosphate dehydrogenase [Furfurilactobacillus]QLE67050.1 NAD-dependent glyceraldehyde-3-phosphate dehydrogenase [Furfurilactobacillus rossiae]MCF6161309.1 type I glyceraldehyde-3-phosphate dehydrogenase [Furfurilactobacillus milii]MCF6163689.1 type I glyceraldehyde-3-phosphate dehydrogenase [Furfurilactobacillus milii]MCF6418940.1 type I glyceraldehyde-3-phosphate dehydrogenase [Furfurilactobacillus milii]MCH4011248.1 type I glyceraldehyde-3-phosphate d
MTVKIGINGFGRIGRLALKRIHELNTNDIEVVAINDLTTPSMLAYLLKYDSTHGKFPGEVSSTDKGIVVDGKEIPVYAERDAKNIPWVKNDGVDYVLECTGFYTSAEKSQAHLDAGAKRVLISAPAGKITTVVPGVNLDVLSNDDKIVSAGSCTTNCLAPLAYFMNEEFGIKVGTMTTVHAFTSTQSILDGPRGSKPRNNRTASVNTIPHSTGAAKALGLVIPELNGKLQGHAQRVAVVDGSLTELVTVLDKKVTADEVNAAIKKHTEGNEAFGYNDDEIVSSDIIDDSHGSVFDPTQTEVTTAGDSQLVKTVAWYDNEWGFTCNMIRTLLKFAILEA